MKNRLSPLSERMRPVNIEEFVGQEHLTGNKKILRHMIETGEPYSIILWGPPGTGKTTLAGIIAKSSNYHFVSLSAVTSGIKEVRQVIADSISSKTAQKKPSLLFIDEIHRFNKAQQDAFLPHVEKGNIILIGATTENPSFEVIAPLLSRTKVLTLEPLNNDQIKYIIKIALSDKTNGLGELNITLQDEAIEHIINGSRGDARVCLNTLEIAAMISVPDKDGHRQISIAEAEEALQKKMLLYDKTGEEHYNIISALHKSLRGSDAHASIYWLARMLEAGEDPLYIARRLIRFASEDIGNADPGALQIALNAKDSIHFLGLPEGKLAIAQATLYLATAPKSNAVYAAYSKAEHAVAETGSLSVPLHIRNAPTKLMKNLGYGHNYKYAHKYPDAIVNQDYLPDKLTDRKFYFPSERGFEKIIKERIEYIENKKRKIKK